MSEATRCAICHRPIKRTEEAIRVLVERVRHQKGDPANDAAMWSSVIDWHETFVSHSRCAKAEAKAQENRVEIPPPDDFMFLFESDGDDDQDSPDLKVVE